MAKNSKIRTTSIKITNKPKVGDIIFGEEEFIIGRKKINDSNIIEVGVTKEQCVVEEKVYDSIISKGFLFQVPRTVEKDVSVIDETRKDSAWVVIEVEHNKKMKLIHCTIPESYRVKAKRLINNEITDDSETIEFYTIGSHDFHQNIVNKKLEVIGHYKHIK